MATDLALPGSPPPAATQPFYIKATAPPEEGDRVLKQGETFAVFDRYGDIKPGPGSKEGVFHEGTRYLSGLLLSLGGERPLLLSSTVRQDNDLLAADLTNLDVTHDGEVVIPRGTLHIARTKFRMPRGMLTGDAAEGLWETMRNSPGGQYEKRIARRLSDRSSPASFASDGTIRKYEVAAGGVPLGDGAGAGASGRQASVGTSRTAAIPPLRMASSGEVRGDAGP